MAVCQKGTTTIIAGQPMIIMNNND